MWCRKILNTFTRRNSSKNSNKRTLHLLRRRRTIRKRGIISLVASLGIMLRIAQMASGSSRRNLQTWLRLMEEHRGMIIYYIQFFQFFIHRIGGWI
jgi:hypothetical protein